jgi:hypothetical protein
MGHQIIRQPDGLYAVFSTGTDTWIKADAAREDLIEWYAERAARDARKGTAELLDDVDEDPRKAYYQFAMTFEEANAESVEHGGEDLSGKMAAAGGEQQ